MTHSSITNLYEDFIDSQNTVFDEHAIRNAVKNILLTNKGSLPGRPEFGSRLLDVPFNLNDEVTSILIKRLVYEALKRWETRIVFTGLTINTNYNSINIKIDYRFKDATLKSSVSVSLLE